MLEPQLLISAYSQGYFPMGEPETGEIHWYRPDPRAILPLDQFHVSRSLHKTLRRQSLKVTFDQDFLRTMKRCAERSETWITEPFFVAYGELARLGFAHSVEVWQDAQLVGGLYGVAIRGAFFGESMFSTVTDASKVALHALVQRLKAQGFTLLEVQFLTDHLKSLGAVEITGALYDQKLAQAMALNLKF